MNILLVLVHSDVGIAPLVVARTRVRVASYLSLV